MKTKKAVTKGITERLSLRLKVKQDHVKGGSPCLSVAVAPGPSPYLLDSARSRVSTHAATNETRTHFYEIIEEFRT